MRSRTTTPTVAAPVGLSTLADELLFQILGQLHSEIENVSVDRRDWLSVSSFKPPNPHPQPPDDLGTVGKFRLTCRRFADIGAQHVFQRLVVRFTPSGIARLQNIAASPHLARLVKKFTYIVPRFFTEGKSKVQEYLETTDPLVHRPSLRLMITKAHEQEKVVVASSDVVALNLAMSSFVSLQHVQLLRVQTSVEADFVVHIRNHAAEAANLVAFDWMPACIRASRTLGQAIVLSNSPVSRLSCQLGAQSAIYLMAHPRLGTALASRLMALSIRFEQRVEADQISPLAETLTKLFAASGNMVSMHLGFPQGPVALPVKDIFKDVRMEKLRVFSIDGWRLNGSDIIATIRQYRSTLRGLRLRGVLLQDGSLGWKDVLKIIRDETELQWISLRKVDYAKHFDEKLTGAIDLTDDENDDGGYSGSEIEDRWEDDVDSDHVQDSDEEDLDSDDEAQSSSDHNSIPDSNTGSDHEAIPESHGLAVSRTSGIRDNICTCSKEDLGEYGEYADNSVYVTKTQWKFWELWTLGRRGCPMHQA